MQGILSKRGNIFTRFNKKYNFLLDGNILRYGKVGKEISDSLDVKEAMIKLGKSNKKDFKIQTQKVKFSLRAQTM
jgi:hypothetical protein